MRPERAAGLGSRSQEGGDRPRRGVDRRLSCGGWRENRVAFPEGMGLRGAHDILLHRYGPAPLREPARPCVPPGWSAARAVRAGGARFGGEPPTQAGDRKVGEAAGAGALQLDGGVPCS